ncbi:hypothetical protein Patl1_19805 [Pistacia atlantica]|uniref:Uncharacterized protein n=1 Tax=Pistacia atlantica TaxID=434234 RepID=A0ACC1BNN1_9ROSI|nr:hypothetical protein Patl1_19805 [Pistacia atlantica]
MATPDEASTLELISQYLLTDCFSIDNFITSLNLYNTSPQFDYLEPKKEPELEQIHTHKPQAKTQSQNALKSSTTLSQRKPSLNKRKNEETRCVESKVVKKEVAEETVTETVSAGVCPLTPSSWTGVWDAGEGIFGMPLLSPLSPHPSIGHSWLTVM